MLENIIIGILSIPGGLLLMAAVISSGESKDRAELALQKKYGVGDQTIREWREKGYIK